uniref:Transmembrane protein n=1 Tax=Kalanchoe fedtschenkoi TaxID=63787 RepID=A0A7N0TX34_KALFE
MVKTDLIRGVRLVMPSFLTTPSSSIMPSKMDLICVIIFVFIPILDQIILLFSLFFQF